MNAALSRKLEIVKVGLEENELKNQKLQQPQKIVDLDSHKFSVARSINDLEKSVEYPFHATRELFLLFLLRSFYDGDVHFHFQFEPMLSLTYDLLFFLSVFTSLESQLFEIKEEMKRLDDETEKMNKLPADDKT